MFDLGSRKQSGAKGVYGFLDGKKGYVMVIRSYFGKTNSEITFAASDRSGVKRMDMVMKETLDAFPVNGGKQCNPRHPLPERKEGK